MKYKTLFVICCVICYALFVSCVDPVNRKRGVNNSKEEQISAKQGVEKSHGKSNSKSQRYDDWTTELYTIVAKADYLTEQEKLVVVEINKCRTNPPRYASERLKPYALAMLSDGSFRVNGKDYMTEEGRDAVNEAIKVLNHTQPLNALKPYKPLFQAAKFHNEDTGPTGLCGHNGTNGDSPMNRVEKYDETCNYVGENISYGFNDAVAIVIQLVVDDGVPSRGHRDNILHKGYGSIGDAIGRHKTFNYMCTIDFGK